METLRVHIGCAALLIALTCAGMAHAECIAPPEFDDHAALALASTAAGEREPEAAGPTTRDRGGRVVAPVMVNGQGPFRFIVDTGANRSALSGRLAQRLGLQPTQVGEVHSISGVELAPMVDVDALSYGAIGMPTERLPVLESHIFAGELGLLGVDGMAGKRLRINFDGNCIEFIDAQRVRPLRGWSTMQGELRFGHLLIVDGRVRDVDIKILIDTGADLSLGNPALRAALSGARGARVDLTSYTAGDLLVLDRLAMVPILRMGDLQIQNIPAFIGDYHIFKLWGLENEPTLLLGMNVLSQARELAIDYHRALLQIRVDSPEIAIRRDSGSRLSVR